MSEAISPNARRWLNTIAFAEGTWGSSGPRYDITFGYKPIKDLSRHPNQVVKSGGYASAAAGAYQIMPSTWASVQKQKGLADFGPLSQDRAALELLRRRGIDPDRDPITPQTVAKAAGEWASLPNLQGKSAYGQPVKSFETLKRFAEQRGAQTQAQSAAPANPAATSQLGKVLLEKFINMLGTTGVPGFGPRSSLPTPDLPDYSEEESADAEAELLLSLYKNKQQQEMLKQEMQEEASFQMSKANAAAEAAKAQLLAQALGSFETPTSTI